MKGQLIAVPGKTLEHHLVYNNLATTVDSLLVMGKVFFYFNRITNRAEQVLTCKIFAEGPFIFTHSQFIHTNRALSMALFGCRILILQIVALQIGNMSSPHALPSFIPFPSRF